MASPVVQAAGTQSIVTGTPLSPGIPSSAGADDLIVIAEAVSSSGNRTGLSSGGAGGGTWVEHLELIHARGSWWIDWKIPTGAEGAGSYSTPGVAALLGRAQALRVSGAHPTAPIGTHAVADGTDALSAAVSLSSLPECLLVWAYSSQGSGANTTMATPPVVGGTTMTRRSTSAAQAWHFATMPFAGGNTGDVQCTMSTAPDHRVILFAILPPPPSGSASGTWEASGTATGSAHHNGSASGSWEVAGTASGEAPLPAVPEGSATGSWDAGGTATGITTHTGAVGGGSASWEASGSASGVASHEGSASGSWSVSGTTSGESDPVGSASGAWTASGSASGLIQSTGSASGSWSISGTGAGTTSRRGSASGSWQASGSASGGAVSGGSATGSWNVSGTASGRTSKSGSASGAWTVGGSASGRIQPRGSASGAHEWAATASGTTARRGSATGSWSVGAVAIGRAHHYGSAVGGHEWSGYGIGPVPPVPRQPHAKISPNTAKAAVTSSEAKAVITP